MPSEAGEFSVVGVFDRVALAQLAQSKLQSLGIEAFIVDAHMISVNWLYSNALGGVKLRVRTEDVLAARRALDADESSSFEEDGDASPQMGVPERQAAEPGHCPGCGSGEVRYQVFSERFALLSLMILNFPLPWLSRRWTCKSCRHEWKI